MGDEVGVEPERLNQVASALENLRDVLAANVPIVASAMQGYWDGGTGQSIIRRADRRSNAVCVV